MGGTPEVDRDAGDSQAHPRRWVRPTWLVHAMGELGAFEAKLKSRGE
jgi:hypothetical protein